MYDITAHLNGLGIQLQGNGKLVFQLFAAVKAFRMILKLYTSKLSKLEICNFPSFSHRIPQRRHAHLGEEQVNISTERQIDLLPGEFACSRTTSVEADGSYGSRGSATVLACGGYGTSASERNKHRESSLRDFIFF